MINNESLNNKLVITIVKGIDEVFAGCDFLDIWGEGDNEIEALSNFEQKFISWEYKYLFPTTYKKVLSNIKKSFKTLNHNLQIGVN